MTPILRPDIFFLGVKTAIFGNGATSIPENSDLNDYTIPGAYRCPNAATAGTITNRPNKSAFQLWYISPYSAKTDRDNWGIQIAFGNVFGIKYRRQSDGDWTDWTSV